MRLCLCRVAFLLSSVSEMAGHFVKPNRCGECFHSVIGLLRWYVHLLGIVERVFRKRRLGSKAGLPIGKMYRVTTSVYFPECPCLWWVGTVILEKQEWQKMWRMTGQFCFWQGLVCGLGCWLQRHCQPLTFMPELDLSCNSVCALTGLFCKSQNMVHMVQEVPPLLEYPGEFASF